jgi:DNA-binding CsgD family transcriptional regulator
VDERAHRFVDCIYAAAVDPARWQDVVDELSVIFHGSPVALDILAIKGEGNIRRFACGADAERLSDFFQRLVAETSWTNRHIARYTGAFVDMAEHLGHIDIVKLDLYLNWMKPMGFAPIWPAGHSILDANGFATGGVKVFRKEGQGPFTESELARASEFVPHLARALQVQHALRDSRSKRAALGEAVDRLPTGVLLLDAERRVVLQNRCARRILGEHDGLRVDASGPSAVDAKDNVRLQTLIAEALDPNVDLPTSGGFAKVKRPSGRREYALLVARLAAGPEVGISSDAVVVVFIVDPESGRSTTAGVLEDLYELTHCEAQIVQLLAQGMTLEEAAAARGVSMNTARSHLKHAFAKTGTGRQSELLRLVIAGVGAISEAERPDLAESPS